VSDRGFFCVPNMSEMWIDVLLIWINSLHGICQKCGRIFLISAATFCLSAELFRVRHDFVGMASMAVGVLCRPRSRQMSLPRLSESLRGGPPFDWNPIMSRDRFDVDYRHYGPFIEYHFCREMDESGSGCFGTNQNHGMSFDEARAEIVKWYEEKAKYWRNLTRQEWHKKHDD
jgi:hypothetical protein